MPKKKTPTELYWDMKVKEQIKNQYIGYLEEEALENNPHSAYLFAKRKIGGGHDYMGIKERDLILLLAGELPYMYD